MVERHPYMDNLQFIHVRNLDNYKRFAYIVKEVGGIVNEAKSLRTSTYINKGI